MSINLKGTLVLAHQLQTVHFGHVQIGEHNIRLMLFDHFQRGGPDLTTLAKILAGL